MKKTVKTILSIVCVMAVVAGMALLAGCGDDKPAVITPSDSTPTNPTVPVPASQMTLNDVMAINDDELLWSRLSVFEHTVGDDGAATFKVADTYGEEATLVVVFDEAADTVSKADLSYGETTVSILTDDNFVLMPIIQAMHDKNAEE